MKIFLSRSVIVIFCVVLQLSFFDVAFPWFHAPLFLIACVVAWTLLSGFPGSLSMTVPLTVLFEIFSTGTIGAFSIYAVFLAYVTSFLSRRLLMSHQGASIWLYAFFSAGMALLYQWGLYLFLHGRTDAVETDLLRLPSELSSGMLLLSVVLVILSFLLAYPSILRFEERMKAIAQRQFLNVR